MNENILFRFLPVQNDRLRISHNSMNAPPKFDFITCASHPNIDAKGERMGDEGDIGDYRSLILDIAVFVYSSQRDYIFTVLCLF